MVEFSAHSSGPFCIGSPLDAKAASKIHTGQNKMFRCSAQCDSDDA